jgi:hypothetical protein
MLPEGLGIVDVQGTFCDKACFDSEVLPLSVQLSQFDGWDEPADLISRQHNKIFSDWERTARM